MTIYLYFDKLLNIFLCIFNFISRVYSTINIKIRKTIKRNKVLRTNKEECFILGNGPSLKDCNLSLLQERDTFTVNFFYKQPNIEFESTYFVAIDQNFYNIPEYKEYIAELYKKYHKMKFILKYTRAFEKFHFDEQRTFYTYAKQFQYGDYVSCDMTKNMTACINVVLQCIQLAIFMGYKKIYLLGCEFSQYATLTSQHAYDDYPGKDRDGSMGSYARWYSMAHFHNYALRKYADQRGIDIINLTPGSLIDAYKRDTFENIVGNRK